MQSWIGDNIKILAGRRLDALVLPGTHDSAAYTLQPARALGPARSDRFLAALGAIFGPCIAPWTVTQQCGVYDQLANGIRFLDLRVARDREGTFFCSHTFACAPLKVLLQDILDFLSHNSSEIVVVTLRPDWHHRATFDADTSHLLLDLITSTCGEQLYGQQPQLPTLRDMLSTRRRLLLFAELPALAAIPSAAAPNGPWLNTGSSAIWAQDDTAEGTVSGLITIIGDLQRGGALPDGTTVWYGAAAATPTARSVTCAVLTRPRGAGLRRLAAEVEAQLPRLLAADLAGVGAVCVDHASPGAVRAVVALNLRG